MLLFLYCFVAHRSLHLFPTRRSSDLAVPPALPPLEGYTFEGFRNADGSVGTKNILGISTSVQCVAGTMEYAVKRIRADRKSTRLNSSHTVISYAVFCLKKKNYACMFR